MPASHLSKYLLQKNKPVTEHFANFISPISWLMLFLAVVFGLLSQDKPVDKDSLLTNLPGQPDSILAQTYIAVARQNFSQPAIADSLGRLAFYAAKRANRSFEQGEGAFIICFANLDIDFKLSEVWADTALLYFEKAGNYKWAGFVTRNMALKANNSNQFESGMRYLQRSTTYFERCRDTLMLVHNLASFSLMYHNYLSDYEAGLRYGLEALKMMEQLKQTTDKVRWTVFNAIAINYDDLNQHDKALEFHLKNVGNASNDDDLASTCNNIGNSYQKKGDYRRAESYFLRSLRLTKKLPDQLYELATVFNNLSHVSWELKRPALAKLYRDSALYFSHKSNNLEKLLDTYYDSYLMCAKNNDYENASRFLKTYIAIKDSAMNSEKTRIIYELQTKYESEKKEQEIVLLRSQSLIKDMQIQQSRNFALVIIFTVIFSAAVIFLVYKRSKYKVRLAHARETEELQRQRFRAVMEAEENERSRVAKDLHDGIGQLLSITKLSLSAIEAPGEDATRLLNNSMQLIDEAAKEVRAISHNMMPATLTEIGLDAALRDLFYKINESRLLHVELHATGLEHRLPVSVEIAIYRVVQEVINNMIKHSKADTIHVALERRGAVLNLSISDNGVGFEKELISKSKGLGWKNILSRISVLNGRIEVDTQPGAGTNISIQFAL
jgi:two-component system, NarL family, sensor kinase